MAKGVREMTPKERADAIVKKFYSPGKMDISDIGMEIEQAIIEAVKESEAKGYVQGHIAGEHYQEEKWFKRGMEYAAEIAKVFIPESKWDLTHPYDLERKRTCEEIAQAIRAEAEKI